MKNRTVVGLLSALVLTAGATRALAQANTSFSYQGSLSVSGAAYTGTADLRFRLYNAAASGEQIGAEITVTGVQVSRGLLTAEVDFGVVFTGQPCWLEIDAKPAAAASFTTLTPRQKITPAPASLFSAGPWASSGSELSYSGQVAITHDGEEALVLKNANNTDQQLFVGVSPAHNGAAWLGSIWQGFNWNTLALQPYGGRVGIGTWQPGAVFQTLGAALDLPAISGGTEDDPFAVYNLTGLTPLTPCFEARAASLDSPPGFIFHHINHLTMGLVPQEFPRGLRVTGPSNEAAAGLFTDGAVGIGTHNPLAKLDLQSGDDTSASHGTYDMAFGFYLGGFRHWIRTLHDGAAPGNSMDFFVNTSATPNGSSAPGVGNIQVMTLQGTGNVGIGTINPGAFRLAVNGTAANSTGSWSVFSDARLKHDIKPIGSGTLDRLLSLHGVEFEYTPEAVHDRNLTPGRTVGFVAQDLEKVFPEWVSQDGDGYRYVTERGTTALVVEALRDLRAEKEKEIATLRSEKDAQIADLAARLQRLEAAMKK